MNAIIDLPAIATLRERGERTRTLFTVAKLRLENGTEGLARIRNVSSGGLMFESRMTVSRGQRVALEVRGRSETLLGTVVWVAADRSGIVFDNPIAVDELLALTPQTASRVRKARTPRGPRLDVDCRIEVKLDDGRVEAQLLDISQGGAKVAMPLPMQRDERAVLMIPGLPMKLAIVRWSGEETGFAFAEPLSFALLAEWLIVRQDGEAWGAGA